MQFKKKKKGDEKNDEEEVLGFELFEYPKKSYETCLTNSETPGTHT